VIVGAHFGELWDRRTLVATLVARELSARYRRSVLGWAWTLLNPLLLLVVHWLVFTRFTRAVPAEGYAVFFLAGILPWLWLASSVTAGATSIVHGASLVTRAPVPPHVLPAVTVLSNLVNLLLGLPVAIALAAFAGAPLGPALLVLPAAALVALPFVYGVTVALATITVHLRDVEFLAHSMVTAWFFVTPIAYPLAAVPEPWRDVLRWNPATALVAPFQEAIHRGAFPPLAVLGAGLTWSVAAAVAGAWIHESRRDDLAEAL
jgi:lipopolysaccharide transport system permease protein